MMYYRISKNEKNLFFGKKIAQVWAVTLSRPFFEMSISCIFVLCPVVSPEWYQKADHPLFSNPALAFWPGVKETGVPLG